MTHQPCADHVADALPECNRRRAFPARPGRLPSPGPLLFLLLLALACAACRPDEPAELRIGFLTNLTHAVPMVMEKRGTLEERVDRPVVFVPFSAGPSAIEALFAGDVDAAYAGPGPAINAFVRSRGQVRVLAGATYGGAAFVVRKDLEVERPRDLKRARLATPQIGNTQDIALRQWLTDNDLASSDRGGTVQVIPMQPSDIFSMFRAVEIDGAWVVEPWVSRILADARGRVLLEEAALHPGGRYPTTLLVVNGELLRERPEEVAALVRANADSVAWIRRNPVSSRRIVNAALERYVGQPLPDALIASAWKRLAFGTDPMPESLAASARAARRLGYLPSADITGIVAEPREWQPGGGTPAATKRDAEGAP